MKFYTSICDREEKEIHFYFGVENVEVSSEIILEHPPKKQQKTACECYPKTRVYQARYTQICRILKTKHRHKHCKNY
ncbi:MAG: hypothetical protein R3Y18_04950 [Bacillota bacterium]